MNERPKHSGLVVPVLVGVTVLGLGFGGGVLAGRATAKPRAAQNGEGSLSAREAKEKLAACRSELKEIANPRATASASVAPPVGEGEYWENGSLPLPLQPPPPPPLPPMPSACEGCQPSGSVDHLAQRPPCGLGCSPHMPSPTRSVKQTCDEKLRDFARRFGSVITFARWGHARDLWLELTRKSSSAHPTLVTALCWFQPRSLTAAELDREAYEELRAVTVSLEVRHLRYWYIQPMPTYLVLYIEAADELLVLNLQHYVERTWGRAILRLQQETATVDVSRDSVLDEQMFEQMLLENDRAEWKKAIWANPISSRVCRDDFEIVLRIGISDTHLQFVVDRLYDGNYIRGAWLKETVANVRRGPDFDPFWTQNIEEDYPYLDLYNDMAPLPPVPEVYDPSHHDDPVSEGDPHIRLSNGDRLRVPHESTRYFNYYFGARLNTLGKDILACALALERLKLAAFSSDHGGDSLGKNLNHAMERRSRFAAYRPQFGISVISWRGSPDPRKTYAPPASWPGTGDPLPPPPIDEHQLRAQAPSVVRVLRQDGSIDPAHDPGIGVDEILPLYRAMVRARLIDERLVLLARQGRICFHFPCLGEEASIVGSAFAMRPEDWIYPGYREFAAALWRGMPLQRYIDHMFGNTNDPAKGRSLPDHFTWRKGRIGSVSSPLGARITQAAGFALAAKLRREDIAALVYFGDGLTSTSEFHSGMNFASVFKAPVVFFCRNNGWAQTTPTVRQTASETFAQKGRAYGVPSVQVDGNDALAVVQVTREALSRAARGEGPTLIEAMTYRLAGHATGDDPKVYRAEAVVETWRKLDPLARLRHHIERMAGWTKQDENALEAGIVDELKTAISAAEKAPAPPLESLFEDVFHEPPWHLVEQRQELLQGPRTRAKR